MTTTLPIKAVFPAKQAPVYVDDLTPQIARAVRAYHQSVPGYQATPLHCLPELARYLGVKNIYVKDESFRFGLNAFKALGATWALARILCDKLGCAVADVDFSYFKQASVRNRIKEMVFVTATDGNHGRGLAWAAAQMGCRTVVYMPAGSLPDRVKSIEKEGAIVRVSDRNYDDSVRLAAAAARENGWCLVQDTLFAGYEKIPVWIIQGYTTMAWEVLHQLNQMGLEMPTHLFLQAGVGSMAASVLGYYANTFKEACPRTFIVEPDQADCMYQSALADDGEPKVVRGELKTMMAGLACGEPNPLAWNILRNLADGFVSCPDAVAASGMRRLARPRGKDPEVVSGASGAVGVGLLGQLMMDTALAGLKEKVNLNRNSVALCFSTEGDTDHENYKAVVNG